MALHGMALRRIGALFFDGFHDAVDAQEKHPVLVRWNGHALFVFVCCDDKMGWSSSIYCG